MKNGWKIFSLVVLVLIRIVVSIAVSDFRAPKQKIEIGEIGKSFTVTLEETDVRDYSCLDTEEFSLLKSEELKKLKVYMNQVLLQGLGNAKCYL